MPEEVCWLDPCDRRAVRLVRVPVDPVATADRDVEALAERLSRTGGAHVRTARGEVGFVTVRISARRPNGTVAAFTVEADSLAELVTEAVPALERLAPFVPADAVWTAEPWTHARPT